MWKPRSALPLTAVLAVLSIVAASGGGEEPRVEGHGGSGSSLGIRPPEAAAGAGGRVQRRQTNLGGLIENGLLSTKCGDCEFRVHPNTRHCSRVLGASGERCGGCSVLWLVGSGDENTDSKPNIKTFDEWIFRGMELMELYIQDHPELTELQPTLFYPLQGLVHLNLRRNALRTLHVLQFKGLYNLEQLSLGENNFDTPLPGAQHYELTSDVWHTPGRFWRTGVFETLSTNLTTLSLDECNIPSIPEGMFSTLTNLKHLFLNGNKIKTLTLDIFGANDYGTDARLGPRNLERLWLQDNEIWYLPYKVFHRLRLLGDIQLTGNRLICVPDFSRFPSSIDSGEALDRKSDELPPCEEGMTPPPITTPPPSAASRPHGGAPWVLAACASLLSAAALCAAPGLGGAAHPAA